MLDIYQDIILSADEKYDRFQIVGMPGKWKFYKYDCDLETWFFINDSMFSKDYKKIINLTDLELEDCFKKKRIHKI